MSTELKLGKRFEVVEKSVVNNYDNYSYHDNYEYYKALEKSNSGELDTLLKDGRKIDEGSFLGHPYSDKDLVLLVSGGKQKLYKDGELCAIGEEISFVKDFYVVKNDQKLRFMNAETQQEMFSLKGAEFWGYNGEHNLIKVDNQVWKIDDGKARSYQRDGAYLPFEVLSFQVSVSGILQDEKLVQSYETVKSSVLNFAFVNENGEAVTLEKFRGHVKEDVSTPKHLLDVYLNTILLYSRQANSSYNVDQEYLSKIKTRVYALREAYQALFKKDIDKELACDNQTVFEMLSENVNYNFAVLCDLFPEEFLKKQDFKEQKFDFGRIQRDFQSDEYLPFMVHFVSLKPEYVSCIGTEQSFLARMIEKQPELIDKFMNTPLEDSLKRGSQHSKIHQMLRAQGKHLYHLEDFTIAPNKKFLQELQGYGFGNHDKAFQKLTEKLAKAYSDFYHNDFVFENAKKLIEQLIAQDKEVVDRNVETVPYQELVVLAELNIVRTPKMMEELNQMAQVDMNRFGYMPSTWKKLYKESVVTPKPKIYPALSLIKYGKNDISLERDYQNLTLDFSDCRDVARPYHLSADSKTTFLNEMLIYGRAEAAAFALAHGASPFQKNEFAHGKKTGMPFAGLFLRAKNNNYKGVKELMVDIAQYLPVDKGPKIINDIEKSLGQTLRQDPYVANVFVEMKQNLGKKVPQKESENSENREQQFAAFYALPQEKLDELDERNRILQEQNVDEYKTLFALYDRFSLDGFRVPYSPENIERLELSIKRQEEEKQARKLAEQKAQAEAKAKEEARAKAEAKKHQEQEARRLLEEAKLSRQKIQQEKEELEAAKYMVVEEKEESEPVIPELSKEERMKQIKDAKKTTKSKSKLKTVGLADLASLLNSKEMG